MNILKRTGVASAMVMAAALGGATAQAASFELGEFSAPHTVAFGNSGLRGPFDDTFNFSIGSGASFVFLSSLSTGFSNFSSIEDLRADLFEGARLVQTGTPTHWSFPFPRNDVDFSSVVLDAGAYSLHISGTGTSSVAPPHPFTSSYTGTITLAAAVPEPQTWALMLMGLVALCAALSRRRGGP